MASDCEFRDGQMCNLTSSMVNLDAPVRDRSKKLDVDVVDRFVLSTFGGRNPANQVRLAVYPIIYDGLYKSQLVSRISSINSIIALSI